MGLEEERKVENLVTPGEVLGKASELIAGKGTYVSPHDKSLYACLTGYRSLIPPPPDSSEKRDTVQVTGHKAHGPVPEPGAIVIARVTRVMAKMASADIMCVGPKSVREKFSGTIRQQDVRATEIDKVDMHSSFRPGDIVRAVVMDLVFNFTDGPRTYFEFSGASRDIDLSLGDARSYYLSTAKNELGVVSAESAAGASMVPISWTEMKCPVTEQIEPRKVAKSLTGTSNESVQ